MPSPKGWCRTSLYSHRKCNFAECLIFNSPPSVFMQGVMKLLTEDLKLHSN
jgi:hypothetical protein